MGREKFYDVVRCELNGPAEEWAEAYRRRFRGLNGYGGIKNLQSARSGDVNSAVGLITLHHLGYDIGADPQEYLNAGIDVAMDYFYGDWWRHDKEGARCVDKSVKRRGLEWFQEFRSGLLLALLSQRWEDVEKLCDWVEADIVVDRSYADENRDFEMSGIYKSIAASLRERPMPGLEKIELQIRKARLERPKLLIAAWDAARNHDQQEFHKGIEKSLTHFAKGYGTGPVAIDWIATHQSILIMAARRLGAKHPELPEALRAHVVCPESIA